MYYERKIKYLDYYEEGEKLRGGGYVKLEIKEDKIRFEISVKGLYPTDSFVRDVILRSSGTEAALGQITIRDGCGSFVYSCNVDKEMGHTGIAYAALREIRIPIGGTRELICPLAEATRSCREQPAISREGTLSVPVKESAEKAKETVEVTKAAEASETAEVSETVEAPKAAKAVETIEESGEPKGTDEKVRVETWKFPEVHKPSVERERHPQQREEASVPQTLRSEVHLASVEPDMQQESRLENRFKSRQDGRSESESEIKFTDRSPGRSEDKSENKPDGRSESKSEGNRAVKKGKTAPRLLEDKWQQLSAIYPHIQPFQDERDYLSINPSDFVLFPSKFYKAVNNSFLLHGYYNYNHLILARMEHRGEVMYYIGVPGKYYDREKQVAVMFGFESFECAAEPAKTGDFGYYLMRMEL